MHGARQVGRIVAAVLGCAFAAGVGATVREGPMPAGSGHARNVLWALKAVNAACDPEEPETVPPGASRAIVEVKREMRSLIADVIATLPPDRVEPEDVQARVVAALGDVGIEVNDPERIEKHGAEEWYLSDVAIVRPAAHSDLLASHTRMRIPCGMDESLVVFERGETGWRPALIFESPPFESIAGAWRIQYAVSPPDETGKWFAVVDANTMWCIGTFHPNTFRIVRPGTSASEPRVLFRQDKVRLSGRTDFEPTRDTLTVRFTDDYPLESDRRDYIRHYRVGEASVERIGPLAQSPGFFVDEWIRLSSEDAARWVATDANPSVPAWHEVLENTGDYQLRFEEPCGDGKTWEVGILQWPPYCADDPPPPPGPDLTCWVYFTVREAGDDFEVVSVDSARSPTCLRPTQGFERPRPGDDDAEETP